MLPPVDGRPGPGRCGVTAPTPDRDGALAEAARREVPAALLRVVSAADPDAFTVEPIYPGAQTTAREPLPVPAARAALRLSRLFEREARRQVRRAREAGMSWAELAPAVDAEDGPAAYEWATGPDRYRATRPFVWRCPACAEMVTDRGPCNGHPDDDESGHARDCARHVAAVAVWLAGQVADDYWDDTPHDTGRSDR